MGIRRLSRFFYNETTGALTTAWTTQATTTYDSNNPAASPGSWGSTPQVALLDRDLDATGSLTSHLGALITFSSRPDFFWGVIVKVIPTYSTLEDPKLEMWTFDGVTWTKRRRVDMPALVRSGDSVVVDLTLSTPQQDVQAVWVTLAPTAAETLSWIALHLYGDCEVQIATPDCPAFSTPPDCSIDCDTLFPDWDCDPEDPTPPPATPFPFPPVTINVPMPHYTKLGNHYTDSCPTPNSIFMRFDIRRPTAGVRVSVIFSPGITWSGGLSDPNVVVNSPTQQTITGSGTMVWKVDEGFFMYFTNNAPKGNGYLPPDDVLPFVTFLFTPLGDFTVLDLLDWNQFLFFYQVVPFEPC